MKKVMIVIFQSNALDITYYLGSTNFEIISPNIKDSIVFLNKLTAFDFASKLENYMKVEIGLEGIGKTIEISI